eukprot:11165705-Lingulodinium_polyedra.AAC.1
MESNSSPDAACSGAPTQKQGPVRPPRHVLEGFAGAALCLFSVVSHPRPKAAKPRASGRGPP